MGTTSRLIPICLAVVCFSPLWAGERVMARTADPIEAVALPAASAPSVPPEVQTAIGQ